MKFSVIHKDQYIHIYYVFYHLRSQFEILRDVKITNVRTVKIFVNKLSEKKPKFDSHTRILLSYLNNIPVTFS